MWHWRFEQYCFDKNYFQTNIFSYSTACSPPEFSNTVSPRICQTPRRVRNSRVFRRLLNKQIITINDCVMIRATLRKKCSNVISKANLCCISISVNYQWPWNIAVMSHLNTIFYILNRCCAKIVCPNYQEVSLMKKHLSKTSKKY